MSAEPLAMFVSGESSGAASHEVVVPTLLAQGPWDPTTLHGGPVAGILARAIEHVKVPYPARIGRLTIDLLKPVPMAPLHLEAEVVRAGRKIHVVDARLVHEGSLVSRASAVLVHSGNDLSAAVDTELNEVAAGSRPPDHNAPLSETFMPSGFDDWTPPGFTNAMELRRVVGGTRQGTPAAAWIRLRKPLVEGEKISPVQQLATIGDFSSGLANYMDFGAYVSPNADLTFHIARYPEGEWIGLDCACVINAHGVGQASARMFDEHNFLGTGSATIVITPRK